MEGQRTAGAALAVRLRERMHANREGVTALAQRLRVSQSYLSELLGGDQPLQGVRNEVIREMAAYLELPPVVCFLLAEKLRHDDFVTPAPSLSDALNGAMDVLAASEAALEAAVTPSDLKALPEPVKLLLVLLYEAGATSRLLRVKRWQWASAAAPAV